VSPQQTQTEDPALAERPLLRAIIADDDAFARKMIKEALQRADVVVIAEAQNGRQAVELALHYHPDVVLMDVVMPELDGIAATRRITTDNPDQVVVLLTSADDDETGLLGLRSGAAGFLSKDVDVDTLPDELARAIDGEAAISRRLAMLRPVKSPLTPREWEVVDLLAESRSTDEIARALVLSNETVRSHVKNIMRKLGARSRQDAVAAAERMRGNPQA
jgi:DNA-binding NarL/FixJ family response regulator